jgi:hypothetical protein
MGCGQPLLCIVFVLLCTVAAVLHAFFYSLPIPPDPQAVQLLHAQLGVIAQLNSDLQAQSVLPLLNELLAPPGPVPPPAVDDLQSGGGTPPQASGAADGEEDRFIGGDA